MQLLDLCQKIYKLQDEIGVLMNTAKVKGTESFFEGWDKTDACNFIKKETPKQFFSLNFAKFL